MQSTSFRIAATLRAGFSRRSIPTAIGRSRRWPALYKEYYKDAAFTFVSDKNINLKQVVNTNKCLISLEKHGDKLLVVSAIDNLLKGASGQAVQNMNLMFGLDQRAGLRLKAAAF